MGRALGGEAVIKARLAAAQGLSSSDAHALAGLVDAEATFAIRPNNGGANWQCGMTLSQRDDDADMLADLVMVTGLGRLFARPAVRTSRPQVTWSVQSKRECAELVRILRRHPLRGRKRLDFAVWANAVETWASAPYDRRGPDLAPARNRLVAVRRYVEPIAGAEDVDLAAPGVRAYLGGFLSGEASLGIAGSGVHLHLHLRRDDRPLLVAIQRWSGLGRVHDQRAYGSSRPSSTWSVARSAELPGAVELLDTVELRGRKRREYAIWRRAALEVAAGEATRASMEVRRRDIAAVRAYRPGAMWRPTPAQRDAGRRQVYAEILREAASGAADLSATEYQRQRRSHPSWPTRNTVALAFGGWRRAVEQALQ
jgi:hypothetical protein